MMVEGTPWRVLPIRGTSRWNLLTLLTLSSVSSSFCQKEEGRKECGLLYGSSTTPSPNYFLSNEERELLGLVCMNFICFSTSALCSLAGNWNSVSASPSLKVITSPTSPGGSWRPGHSRGFSASRGPMARASSSIQGSMLLGLEGGGFPGPRAGSVPTF